ncbi:MAG: hypothetical protein WDO15_30425 [Bacteroidota bacterium]
MDSQMMFQHLLSFLIFLPVAAALVLLALPSSLKSYHKWIALGVSIIQILITLGITSQFQAGPGFQLTERTSWISISQLKAEYFVGIDGLSFPLILLAVFILLIAVISSWNVTDRSKGYFALLLIIERGYHRQLLCIGSSPVLSLL